MDSYDAKLIKIKKEMTVPKPKPQETVNGRDYNKDLMTVCTMIVNSLDYESDPYDCISQDSKRPFGNSGGPWYDIMEKLNIEDQKCPNCDHAISEDGLEYAKKLWYAALPFLKEGWKTAI